MSKYPVLAIPFVLIIMIVAHLAMMRIYSTEANNFAERQLDIAINYAVDAAVDELLQSSGDLDADYTKYGSVKLNPNIALNEFCSTMIGNMGEVVTERSISAMKSGPLGVFMVADYDGYYLATQQEVSSNGSYDLVFQPKRPYTYREAGVTYGLNLGGSDALVYDGTVISKRSSLPFNKQFQVAKINEIINEAYLKGIKEFKGSDVTGTFYVPLGVTSINKTNMITGITVMAYMSNYDTGTGKVLDNFAIGGAKVESNKFVAGYIRDGIKYYAKTELVPNGTTILEMFDTPEDAAKQGYYFDPTYLQ